MENNFLEVSDWTHCLKCHEEVPRTVLLEHFEENCPKMENEARMEPKTCGRCGEFKLMSPELGIL